MKMVNIYSGPVLNKTVYLRSASKLSLVEGDDKPRPAKVVKTFTSTPEELVKLCAAFAQATSAACNSHLTPLKLMENLIDRFERARDKQTQMAASVNTE